jgi:rRNA maturation endonuclease Nob1
MKRICIHCRVVYGEQFGIYQLRETNNRCALCGHPTIKYKYVKKE